MKILLLGATGYIGSAVLQKLIAEGSDVTALARSDRSAQKLANKNITIIRGDMSQPADWIKILQTIDVVIHVAATFLDDMGDVDATLVEAICRESQKRSTPLKVLYTGGVWLYGDTGGNILNETAPYRSIASFQWMIDNWIQLKNAENIEAIFLHPAMVYDEIEGGVLERSMTQAKNNDPIEIWGRSDIHWPLVHKDDLAEAYYLALTHATTAESYLLISDEGILLSRIIDDIRRNYKQTKSPITRPLTEVIQEQGDWAEGPALDQKLSGDKAKNMLSWAPRHTYGG